VFSVAHLASLAAVAAGGVLLWTGRRTG